MQPRSHGLLSSSPVGTRLIYRPRVLGSVFSGGEGEGAGERLSHFSKGKLVTILEDLITYIYTLSSYPRWSFGVFLWELFTLGKLASSSSSFFFCCIVDLNDARSIFEIMIIFVGPIAYEIKIILDIVNPMKR